MRSARSGVLAALSLVLALVPGPLLAFCRPELHERRTPSGVWGLEAPDGSTVVWSDTSGFPITEVSPGAVGRLRDGGFFGSGTFRFQHFCPMDWSADSRYLLARELTPTVLLDQYDRRRYWTLERGAAPRELVDFRALRETVERYWHGKGRDVAVGGGYYLEAAGWETPTGNRIVVKAWRRATLTVLPGVSGYGTSAGGPPGTEPKPTAVDPPAARDDAQPELSSSKRFLGYWSIERTGNDPRLLAEQAEGFVVPRFGKYLPSRPSVSTPPFVDPAPVRR